jgi:hypothetical protein
VQVAVVVAIQVELLELVAQAAVVQVALAAMVSLELPTQAAVVAVQVQVAQLVATVALV